MGGDSEPGGGVTGWVDQSYPHSPQTCGGAGACGSLRGGQSWLERGNRLCQDAGGVRDVAQVPWRQPYLASFRSSSQKSMLRMVCGPRRR